MLLSSPVPTSFTLLLRTYPHNHTEVKTMFNIIRAFYFTGLAFNLYITTTRPITPACLANSQFPLRKTLVFQSNTVSLGSFKCPVFYLSSTELTYFNPSKLGFFRTIMGAELSFFVLIVGMNQRPFS